MPGPLGLVLPPDYDHFEKYGLTPETTPVDVAVAIGIPWYKEFDFPKQLGTSFHLPDIAKGEKLSSIRGYHCVCLEPLGAVTHNKEAVRRFYNQKAEGACAGFGTSRVQTVNHGAAVLFDGFTLYDEARKLEGTYPDGEGSTVRSNFNVLKNKGHRVQTGEVECTRGQHDAAWDATYGISAYRWTTDTGVVLTALNRQNALAVPLVNSWGDDYPAVVWLPVATLERILKEQGEAGVPTER